MLREMLSNLIDNAIRYTPPGGKSPCACGPKSRDTTPFFSKWKTRGSGIPAAERERVVERFYRILGREGDGSGLGLRSSGRS